MIAVSQPAIPFNVPARQLRLFDHPKPLLERLGPAFFKAVPRSPGVYLMFGSSDRILYIGQTGNLRVRLGTYKNCNPNHLPRRIVRLLHQVDRIEWQPCADKREARLRENHLLRVHRPRFNRMNTFPAAYYFFGVKRLTDHLHLWLTRDLNYTDGMFGAFKGNTRQAFGALVMLLWAYIHRPNAIEDFPAGLLSSKPPRSFTFHSGTGDFERQLPDYLNGTSTGLLDRFAETLPDSAACVILRALYEAALSTLLEFYASGPRRTRTLREENGVQEHLVAQDRLDDLIVLSQPQVPKGRALELTNNV